MPSKGTNSKVEAANAKKAAAQAVKDQQKAMADERVEAQAWKVSSKQLHTIAFLP